MRVKMHGNDPIYSNFKCAKCELKNLYDAVYFRTYVLIQKLHNKHLLYKNLKIVITINYYSYNSFYFNCHQ